MQMAMAKAPPRQPASLHWMPPLFLVASFLVSLAFLGLRNIYDDEIGTTDLLPVSTHQIIATMNHADVHPPGMYVLDHLGYQVIHSARWVTLFPLACLYLGLAVFVMAYSPFFQTRATQFCFLFFATLHPQLLMWGNSIRWYPWWTGLALIAVVVALNPRTPEQVLLPVPRALSLGLLLGCLFYLNYITLLFGMAIAAGLLVRYGLRVCRRFLVTVLVAFALAVPQLHAFVTVHMKGSSEQRSNPLLSLARLLQSLLSSEAYLPWHPLAIVAAILLFTLTCIGLFRAARFVRCNTMASLPPSHRAIASVVVLSLVFLVLIALSGLGGKPRNGLALIPLLAPAAALVVGGLRSRSVQVGTLAVLSVWSMAGITHLLRREGLTKSGMNNRPEEVLRFIETSRGDRCSVVITYDPILSFYLVESHLPKQLVLTGSQNNLYRNAAPFHPAECAAIDLYIVQSYLGGFGSFETVYPAQLKEATRFLRTPLQVHSFSYDPDARFKRRLHFVGGTASLPDYRYIVGSGQMAPNDLKSLEDTLGYLTIADGHSVPRLP